VDSLSSPFMPFTFASDPGLNLLQRKKPGKHSQPLQLNDQSRLSAGLISITSTNSISDDVHHLDGHVHVPILRPSARVD